MNVGCYYCVLTTSGTLTTVPSQPSLIPGPDSRQVVFLSLLTFWVVFWEQWLGYSGDVLGLFAEEHDSEENEKRRKKKKGTTQQLTLNLVPTMARVALRARFDGIRGE